MEVVICWKRLILESDKVQLHCQVGQSIQESGEVECETVRVLRNGPTAPNMLVSGSTIKQMAMEHFIMLMEMSTRASGSMIRQMAKEYTIMQMVQTTMENGKTTSNMDSVWKDGLMVQSMKDSTSKEKRMVVEN